MKFKVKRTFSIQLAPNKVKTYQAGEYQVPQEMTKYHADRAASMGSGEYVMEKKAPENKVVKTAENKAGVGRKTKRRRRTRPKSDA